MACSPVGDRCTYEASGDLVNFKGLRILAEIRGVRSRKLLSDSGQDWPSRRTRLRRDWPSGQTRLQRGLLGSLPLVAHAGSCGRAPVWCGIRLSRRGSGDV
jgi:hypothetical protein